MDKKSEQVILRIVNVHFVLSWTSWNKLVKHTHKLMSPGILSSYTLVKYMWGDSNSVVASMWKYCF